VIFGHFDVEILRLLVGELALPGDRKVVEVLSLIVATR